MRFLFLLLLLFLNGCTNRSEIVTGDHDKQRDKKNSNIKLVGYKSKPNSKDGAPAGPPPKTFQKVKPRYAPFSRYGNPESYAINGRKYDVLRSASGYKARGTASWYGTKFHSRRTSSGDDYDMYAMTAAHKTLPLPSYVRVRNLNNGKEAVVKVNDRGPFHADRVIDLSYAAATKLGIFPKGTATVEIEALTVKGAGNKHIAYYYVQAGAFNSQALATALRNKLARLTPSPVFIERYRSQYIVRVGPFANKRMTDNLKSKLALKGVKGAFSFLQ